ncbi:unnamed protein product [Danaus chrysippus]|uniref:(African queen) hypothetical protein n=1 Tax=Danaus chrysippus TaxID=151541 RepID=A0A8J2QZS0_9NEOP|nr:unnamed protein product [Danaus chrysippus]
MTQTRMAVILSPRYDRDRMRNRRDVASGRGGGATTLYPDLTRVPRSPQRRGEGDRPPRAYTSVCTRRRKRSLQRSEEFSAWQNKQKRNGKSLK